MRLITRQLSSLIRSRRRISFLIVISILIIIALILSIIDENYPSKSFIEEQQDQQLELPNNSTTKTITIRKNSAWPVDDKGRSLKTKFLVLDWNGFFGAENNEGGRVECPSSNTTFIWTSQKSRTNQLDFLISHDALSEGIPFDRLQLNSNQQQYSMAFVIESEVHSSTGSAWANYNFKMTHNLDDSYPEPATYFDMNRHLIDLLTPSMVPFEEKEKQADVVWIVSNCNAHNGREVFVQRLMEEMKIDAYGACLNNRRGYAARMVDNIDAYKKYKFVIAIENSNCQDYVTEKLVMAVTSGSIPIVAGCNNRPDYRRYMPEHSYINIFDYTSIKALANDLKRIGDNKTLYESYLWYKQHNKTLDQLKERSLDEKLKHFADVIGSNATMIVDGIAGKEKSENKICKLIRFVRQTSWEEIAAHNRTARADSGIACLPHRCILKHFDTINSTKS